MFMDVKHRSDALMYARVFASVMYDRDLARYYARCSRLGYDEVSEVYLAEMKRRRKIRKE